MIQNFKPDHQKSNEAKELINVLVSTVQRQRQRYEDKWDMAYNHYRGITTKCYYEGLAKIFDPETYNAVDTRLARARASLFPSADWFTAEGREEKDKDITWLLKIFMQYQHEEAQMILKFLKSLRQLYVYGTTVNQFWWRKDTQQIFKKSWFKQKIENVFGSIVGQTTDYSIDETYEDVYDNIDMESVPLPYFYIDPRKNIDTAPGIVREQMVPLHVLKRGQERGIYFDVDNLQPYTNKGGSRYYDPNKKPADVPDIQSHPMPEINCKTYWGKFELKRKNEWVESLIVLANDETVIRFQQNPYLYQHRPFVSARCIPVDDEFYGIGVPELIESMQNELNDSHCMTLDAGTQDLCRMTTVLRGSGILPHMLKFKPNRIIYVNTHNDIAPLNQQRVQVSGYEKIGDLKENMRQVASAYNSMQGIPFKSGATATEVSETMRGGDLRITLNLALIEEELIKPILYRQHEYNQQFVTTEKVVRVVGSEGQKWETVKPDMFGCKVDFSLNGAGALERKAVQQNQLLMYGKVVAGIPQVATIFNFKKWCELVYEGFGLGNSQTLWLPPEGQLGLILKSMMNDFVEKEKLDPASAKQGVMTYIQNLLAQAQPAPVASSQQVSAESLPMPETEGDVMGLTMQPNRVDAV